MLHGTDTLGRLVEPYTQIMKHTDFSQHADSHENAEEEKDGGDVNTRKHVCNTLGHRIVLLTVAIEDIGDNPKDGKHTQNAYERRKVSDSMENRY